MAMEIQVEVFWIDTV